MMTFVVIPPPQVFSKLNKENKSPAFFCFHVTEYTVFIEQYQFTDSGGEQYMHITEYTHVQSHFHSTEDINNPGGSSV